MRKPSKTQRLREARFRATLFPFEVTLSFGHGSKLNDQGTAGFASCFHLPGFQLGYLVLTHCHLDGLLGAGIVVRVWQAATFKRPSVQPVPFLATHHSNTLKGVDFKYEYSKCVVSFWSPLKPTAQGYPQHNQQRHLRIRNLSIVA